MKGDVNPVAFALSQRLPVRTHTRREIQTGLFAGNNRMAVRINGQVYGSLSEACAVLKLSHKAMSKLRHNGEAEIV